MFDKTILMINNVTVIIFLKQSLVTIYEFFDGGDTRPEFASIYEQIQGVCKVHVAIVRRKKAA